MHGTSGRLLKLLSLLQTRRDWPGGELADRLEVSPRTIRRDVERLRDLGYPVEASTGPFGGYRLHAGTAMPPLLLDDDEAVAIAVGLRTAAGASVTGIEETAIRALVKLEQVLADAPAPARQRAAVGDLDAARDGPARGSGGADDDRRRLPRPRAAALRLQRARRDGVAPRRRAAEPREPRPALVPRRVGLRPRRLAHVPRRPARASAAGGRALHARTLPGDGDPAAYVASNLRQSPNRYNARITVHAPAAQLAERWPWMRDSLTPIDDASCEYRTSDDSLDWLAMRVGMIGADFEIHEPPELVDAVRALGKRLAQAAG